MRPSRGAEVMPVTVTGSPLRSTPTPGTRTLTVSPETARPSSVGGSGGSLGSSAGTTVTCSRPVARLPSRLRATYGTVKVSRSAILAGAT